MIDSPEFSPLAFRLNIVPPTVTAQTKRAVVIPGKGVRFFPSPALKKAEELLARYLAAFRQPAPMLGPVECRLTLVWPYRLSEKASVKKSGQVVPHYSRPDLDNLSKIYVDALVKAGFLKDDGQIASLILKKGWGPEESVGVFYEILPITPSGHQERVIAEKTDLDERATKLSRFIGESPVFGDLPPEERERMKVQNDLMWQLSEILGERIANF